MFACSIFNAKIEMCICKYKKGVFLNAHERHKEEEKFINKQKPHLFVFIHNNNTKIAPTDLLL